MWFLYGFRRSKIWMSMFNPPSLPRTSVQKPTSNWTIFYDRCFERFGELTSLDLCWKSLLKDIIQKSGNWTLKESTECKNQYTWEPGKIQVDATYGAVIPFWKNMGMSFFIFWTTYFYQSTADLQCCISFCCRATCLSCVCLCVCVCVCVCILFHFGLSRKVDIVTCTIQQALVFYAF